MAQDYLRLAEKAYALLEEKIINLQLAPGQVYSEAEISTLIKIGRTPMREALLRLAKEKLVEMIPRRGVCISNIDLTNHIALLETRKALDVLIATRAAKRVTQKQKQILKEYSAKILEAGNNNDIEQYTKIDNELDILLATACRNAFAVEAVAHLYAHCKRFWAYYHDHANIKLFAKQHSNLMLAVASSNEQETKKAVKNIINHQIEFTKSALDL